MPGTRGDLQNCLMLIYLVTHVRALRTQVKASNSRNKIDVRWRKGFGPFFY